MTPKNAVRPAPEVPPSDSEFPLREAIESMHEAFAYFDAGDRLVFCNKQYRKMHRLGPDFFKPGIRFEDIIRTNVERGNIADAIGREEEHRESGALTRRLFPKLRSRGAAGQGPVLFFLFVRFF